MIIRQLVLLSVLATPILVQTPTGGQPRFEAASIHRNNSGSRAIGFASPPGRFVGTNLTLRMLITHAYRVQDFQVTGGPGWMNSERYDVQAKAEDRPNGDEINGPMLQQLLEDRFKLSIRHDTQELPVYVLTIAKSGAKLKSGNCSAVDPNTTPGPRRSDSCGFSVMDNNMIKATHIEMARFIPMLTVWVKRTIIDKTGFTETFDVDLKWNPDETAGNLTGPLSADGSPSIFTAVEEQLGLKLESAKGPVEVLVVERAERPSEN
jgi:uncharacterized protein (TIGR03435 family)